MQGSDFSEQRARSCSKQKSNKIHTAGNHGERRNTCKCLKLGQLLFQTIYQYRAEEKEKNRGQVESRKAWISFLHRSSCPNPNSRLNTRMLKAKLLGHVMWEVKEHGLNMGEGLRTEPAGKGKTAQIRNKGRFLFLFFFFFWDLL